MGPRHRATQWFPPRYCRSEPGTYNDRRDNITILRSAGRGDDGA